MFKQKYLNSRIGYRFRRFTRKAYAAFASLHKQVSIGRVSAHVCDREMLKAGQSIAACLLCCISLNSNAADDSSVPLTDIGQLTIEEVQVIAQQAELQSQNLRVVNSLSAEAIRGLPVATVSDLLDYLPGIDARTRGSNGVQTDFSVRGGSFDQVLVLLNGQNMTDPQTGHYSAELPIDIDIIERIDILEGTSMDMFGLSAFSGAINIITKSLVNDSDTLQHHATVRLEGGDYGLFHPAISGVFASKNASFTANVSYNQTSGYTHNTDSRIGNVFFHSLFNNKSGKWNLQIGAQYKGAGANSFYSLSYPDQFDATKTGFAGLAWQKRIKRFTLKLSLSYKAHHDRFELFRSTWKSVEPASWYTAHNYHLTQTAGANFSLRYASSVGTTIAGIEVRNENILSNVLGDARPDRGNSVFTYSKNRLNLNYFAQQNIYHKGLSVGLGVAGNWNTMFGNNFVWGVNIGYALPYNIRIYANANQGVRLPTFTDLYYKSATQIANPSLKPEKAITTEIGIAWQNSNFSAKGTAYYRWGRNIIDWVLTPDDERWQSRNLTQVNAAGCEIQASYTDNNWIRSLSVGYSFCHLDKHAEGYLSKYALDYLRHKCVLQLNHRIWKGLGASWALSFHQREGAYNDKEGNTQNYKPVVLFDGKIYYEWRMCEISVDATNIIGTQYYDYGGIEQPRRWIKGTVAVKL